MSVGAYGILIVFGLFVLLLVLNPKLSCFGKRIRSPFYPLLRKNAKNAKTARPQTHDYGFHLVDGAVKEVKKETDKKTDDYGFKLG
jgi:hypothetical protein